MKNNRHLHIRILPDMEVGNNSKIPRSSRMPDQPGNNRDSGGKHTGR